MATSYHLLGMVEQRRGRLDAAQAWYEKSLTIRQELGDRRGMALSYAQVNIQLLRGSHRETGQGSGL